MNGDIVLYKTFLGLKEIQSSSRRLTAKLRMILILIDGKSTYDELQTKVSSLSQAEEFTHFEESLIGLINAGYITDDSSASAATGYDLEEFTVPSNDLRWTDEFADRVKGKLKAIATDVLGDQAGKVVKKLDDAPNHKEGIISVLSDCNKLVRLFIDEKKAGELEKRCSALLNKTS